jgi:hypothetical protein
VTSFKGEADGMTEVDERIARLEELIDTPASSECDADVLRHHLCQLRQLRAETALDSL